MTVIPKFVCTKCKTEKYYIEFGIDNARFEGYNAVCKQCVNSRNKKDPLTKVKNNSFSFNDRNHKGEF